MRRRDSVLSAYLRGAGRIVDLRGARSRYAGLLRFPVSDADAMRQDWAGVWEDLGAAMHAVNQRLAPRAEAGGGDD